MIVLGVSGRHAHAAAALAVDGRPVAAASEGDLVRIPDVGYAAVGGFPLRAAAAALAAGRLEPGDLDGICLVRRTRAPRASAHLRFTSSLLAPDDLEPLAHALAGRLLTLVDAAEAHARQAMLAAAGADALIVVLDDSEGPVAAVYRARDGALRRLDDGRGFDRAACLARALARQLGGRGPSPWADLRAIGSGAEGDEEVTAGFRDVLTWEPDEGFQVNEEAFGRLMTASAAGYPEPLSARSSLHVPLQQRRAALARACADRIGSLALRMAAQYADAPERLLAAGSLFRDPGVGHGFDRSDVAPLPEPAGAALGAAIALDGGAPPPPLSHLLLGPGFTESDIKLAIENSRLDYVYEPDWTRLFRRLSAMLAAGKLVGWFQNRMEFGSLALGARGVLADPSNRYARDNLIQLLGPMPAGAGFPVSLPESFTADALGAPVRAPFGRHRVTVPAAQRGWCAAALDHGLGLTVHTVSRGVSPEFHQLLDVHHAGTGVPGLINVPLRSPGDARACAPVDALQTMFATPIDALVCGRFLLMKDYWLLRSAVDAEGAAAAAAR